MDFDFSDEQHMLREQCSKMLDSQSSLRRVREVFEGDERFDRPLWSSMAELGWQGVAIPEAYGGAGLGQLELAVIAEELGRHLAAVPFSSSVYLVTNALMLAGSQSQKERFLPLLATGELIGCFAEWNAGEETSAAMQGATLSNASLTGVKAPVIDGDIADIALVTCKENGALTLALVDLRESDVVRTPLLSFDHSRSQARLDFNGATAERLGKKEDSVKLLREIVNKAAVLLAFEQLGGAGRCLELACEYSKERFAFGRAIGSFQAIQHKLADLYTAQELARANTYYGAWALDNAPDELPVAAAVARISATEAFTVSAEESLHTHGGVGFTWDYDCHLFVRRASLLSLSLGSARLWKRALVDSLQEGLRDEF